MEMHKVLACENVPERVMFRFLSKLLVTLPAELFSLLPESVSLMF